jgi:hypothetical protein
MSHNVAFSRRIFHSGSRLNCKNSTNGEFEKFWRRRPAEGRRELLGSGSSGGSASWNWTSLEGKHSQEHAAPLAQDQQKAFERENERLAAELQAATQKLAAMQKNQDELRASLQYALNLSFNVTVCIKRDQ